MVIQDQHLLKNYKDFIAIFSLMININRILRMKIVLLRNLT
ncbi:UNVERIFIED_CONTAM: hypothetical protein GTU68_030440 [Idotea baltica]|nr:hypothetical protein [Idotea baltica]